MMRGRRRFHRLAITACLFAVTPAYAATITLFDGYGDTNGGEFHAVPSGLSFMPLSTISAPGQFETFCVETNENIQFGQPYYADVSTAAIHGGAGGGDPDPLDPMTAYLYTEFITGQLTDYAYGVLDGGIQRAASADALQHVIWYIENEEAQTWSPGDNSLRDKFYQNAQSNAGPGIGLVRVLNLWSDESRGSAAQDQLVLTPEPATAVFALLGMGVFTLNRRR